MKIYRVRKPTHSWGGGDKTEPHQKPTAVRKTGIPSYSGHHVRRMREDSGYTAIDKDRTVTRMEDQIFKVEE